MPGNRAEGIAVEPTLDDAERPGDGLLDELPVVVFRTTATRPTRFTYLSKCWERSMGWTIAETLERNVVDLVHPDDVEALRTWRDGVLSSGDISTMVTRLQRADGAYRRWEFRARSVNDEDNGYLGMFGTLTDVNERVATEEALRASEARFRALVTNSTDATMVLSAEGRPRYVSPAAARLLRQAPGVDALLADERWVHPDDRPAAQAVLAALLMGERGDERTLTVRIGTGDGPAARWLECRLANQLGVPGVDGIVLNAREVTDRVRVEELLRWRATHDDLTGLLNRRGLLEAWQGDHGVLFADLDRFKQVNDMLGHDIGDVVLHEAAHRVTVACPGCLVARNGGDEFVVLVEPDEAKAMALAEGIVATLNDRFTIGPHRRARIGASVGVALPLPDEEPEDTLGRADLAMFAAKGAGRGQVMAWTPEFALSYARGRAVEVELHDGFERGELEVHYQPEADLLTGEIVGAEALLRWHHPTRGLLVAGSFISAAARIGLMAGVTRWTLLSACNAARGWVEAVPRFVVRVNVDATLACSDALIETVLGTLEEVGLAPEHLCIEITESALLEDAEVAGSNIKALRDHGVAIDIDDFGTGYSSLLYIKRFPVTGIKLDKGFVQGLGSDARDDAIVTSAVELARKLGLTVCAEGVEQERHERQLLACGVTTGQGLRYGAAMTAAVLTSRLTS